jgi:hypothetical protein
MARADPEPPASLSQARSLIAGYVDHLQEPDYAGAVFALAALSEIDRLPADMLRGGDREEAGLANLFVRDTVLFGFSPAFRQRLPSSRTLRALRENLYARATT